MAETHTHPVCPTLFITYFVIYYIFKKITKDTSWEVRQFLSSNTQSIDIESFALGAEQNNWLKLVSLMNSDAIQRRDLWAQPCICPWCTLALTFQLVQLTPMAPRTQAVTGTSVCLQSPIPIPCKQDFANISPSLSLMKATVPEEKCRGSFYPWSLTMRGQIGTVKRAWALETCSPGFEPLPHYLIAYNNDNYYLLRVYSVPDTCIISLHLHSYPMKQVLLILHLQMKKQRHRKMKELAQSHTASIRGRRMVVKFKPK